MGSFLALPRVSSHSLLTLKLASKFVGAFPLCHGASETSFAYWLALGKVAGVPPLILCLRIMGLPVDSIL